MDYPFESIKTATQNNQPMPKLDSAAYLYYIQNQEIVTPNFINADWPSKSTGIVMSHVSMDEKNMSATIISAERLTDALEEGELQGKLKVVALTLAPDDNPILMLVKFK